MLIEVGGVGYRVVGAPVTVAGMGELSTEVFVWTHHHVREDAQVLYGFSSRDERDAFEALLGGHGVGPALALAILSVHSPSALHQVLADDDVNALCMVPGVGKKTAARLLIELKSRLALPIDHVPKSEVDAATGSVPTTVRSDVRDALAGLGYGLDEIVEATRELTDGSDPEAMLKQALLRLSVRSR